jgi:hypothetical protein
MHLLQDWLTCLCLNGPPARSTTRRDLKCCPASRYTNRVRLLHRARPARCTIVARKAPARHAQAGSGRTVKPRARPAQQQAKRRHLKPAEPPQQRILGHRRPIWSTEKATKTFGDHNRDGPLDRPGAARHLAGHERDKLPRYRRDHSVLRWIAVIEALASGALTVSALSTTEHLRVHFPTGHHVCFLYRQVLHDNRSNRNGRKSELIDGVCAHNDRAPTIGRPPRGEETSPRHFREGRLPRKAIRRETCARDLAHRKPPSAQKCPVGPLAARLTEPILRGSI